MFHAFLNTPEHTVLNKWKQAFITGIRLGPGTLCFMLSPGQMSPGATKDKEITWD